MMSLQNLLLEAAECVLQRLAFLELYFSPRAPPTSTRIPVDLHSKSAAICAMVSYGFFRRRSDLTLSQPFRQFLAGPEARIPFCGDRDCLPGARVTTLTFLSLFH